MDLFDAILRIVSNFIHSDGTRAICSLTKRIMFLVAYIVFMHILNFRTLVTKCESLNEHILPIVALFYL